MKKIALEILGLSSSHSESGSFALVLGEEEGNRRLPIIIGMFEAQAIAMEIEKMDKKRPMTHDLFVSFANQFEFEVKEVFIADLQEGVFFAKIISSSILPGGETFEIDARPSDAIAIGLRFDVPIYIREDILTTAGIPVDEESEDESEEEEKRPSVSVKKKNFIEILKDLSGDELQSMIVTALDDEDYEKAAQIRDELQSRGVS